MTGKSLRGLVRVGISALVLVNMAGMAAAQDAGSDPVLRGPKVRDNSAPGERSTFSGGRPRGKDAQRPIPQPAFMKAVMTLNAEGAAAETRLTEAQQSQLKTIEQEFRAQQREFAQAHRDEARELAASLPPEDRARVRELLGAGGEGRAPGKQVRQAPGQKSDKAPGKKPPKGEPRGDRPPPPPPPPPGGGDEMMAPGEMDGPMREKPSEAQVEEARARLKELIAQAPKPEQARSKMWGVLSEPQRKLVEVELAKTREEMANRAADQGKKKNAGADGEGPVMSMDDPRIPEKARERLKNLSPEQREEAIKRLKERRPENGKRPAGRKPAPPLEEVDIPAPEQPK